jgi:hypothetical protein
MSTWLLVISTFNLLILRTYTNEASTLGVLHIVGFIGVMITLGVMSEKNSRAFVFTDVVNSSGWGSDGVSWLIGLQSAVFPMLGYVYTPLMSYEYPSRS